MSRKIFVLLTGIAGQAMMQGEAYASEDPSSPLTGNTVAGRINPETGAWETTHTPVASTITPAAGRINVETRTWETTLAPVASTMAGPSQMTKIQEPFQFYAGVSGGVDRMTGHRNESIFNPSDVTTSIFASNRSFSNNDAQYSVFGGISFNLGDLPLFFAPEFYLGRGHTTNELRNAVPDDPGLSNTLRTVQASIQHRYFWGTIIQAGVNLSKEFRGYVLLGLDSSQYRYTAFYIPRSAGVIIGPGTPDEPSSYFSITKWNNSVIWGFGIEKTIHNKFRLGADIRFLRSFKTFQFSSQAPSGDPANPDVFTSFFKPKNIRLSLRLAYLF